ncbi:glycosyltransferase family 2 protein [Georgenia sp. 311]|uniref:Glycosyltransferase family 2 protein n=1 Tax=Georgenia wutianyii TaxID=2585135 RepID=A0ABX5VK13_9MICO|nr:MULTISPECIES: glycosyltransferase family 2 protein [Georgenia]QDB78468.1 glycosyltransferase family 2 protein [Georgenia wutianyii]TNC16521.1 glycosyltransferase family 2 protein [Georgenia sp. 311]
MNIPAVRVVTVAFNPGEELETFATSLAGATSREVTLVVVDNGTRTDVVDDVARRHGAQVLRPGTNLGYGAAANLGAREGEEPWVVVANPDIRWEPGSLDALLDAAARHPRAGSLGPQVLNTDGTVYPSARAIPSLTEGIGHALFVRVWPGNPWTRRYHRRQEQQEVEHAAGWLSGACLLLRREAMRELGGFDESYFMFFEDTDLGDRLGQAGWENVYVPAARVVHDQGASWRERPAPMIRAHHRSAELYLHRRYAAWYQLPLRVAISLGLRARAWLETRPAR